MSNEVKKIIRRIVEDDNEIWLHDFVVACESLAREDAVMKMMADTYEASGGDGPHSDFMCNNMRAALLALARECDWRSQGSVKDE